MVERLIFLKTIGKEIGVCTLVIMLLATMLFSFVRTAGGVDVEDLWAFGTGGNVLDMKPLDDVNDDGISDVVVGSGDNNVYVLDGDSGEKIWSRIHADGDIVSVDSIDDITLDGICEVVAGCAEGKQVYCHNGATGDQIWNRTVERDIYRIHAMSDVNDDGISDVVVGFSQPASGAGVSCISGFTGEVSWTRTYGSSDSYFNDLTGLPDVTGDGRSDVVVGFDNYQMELLDGSDGTVVVARSGLPNISDQLLKAISDVSGDDWPDLLNIRFISGSSSGAKVLLLSGPTLEIIWQRSWDSYSLRRVWDASAGSDVTGDGRLDIVVGYSDKVYCLDGVNGTKPIVWEATVGTNTNYLRSWRIAADQDISGDGVRDPIVGAEDGKVYFLNGIDGSTLYPAYSTGDSVGVVSYIQDVSSDLLCEVLAGSNDHHVYCLTPPTIEIPYAYLVIKGGDDRIWYRNYDGSSWGSWNVVPTGATGNRPAAAMLGSNLHFVVQGLDGYTLWHGYLGDPQNPESFQGWYALDGSTPSAPTLTSNGTTLCLVVRGLDNRVYYRCYNGDSWGPWEVCPPGGTNDSPAATLVGDKLHLCIRGEDGEDLWFGTKNLETSSWTGWTPIPGSTPSAPTLTSNSAKTYLAVRGSDNQIWYNVYDGSTWSGWMGTRFPGGTNTSPAATAYGGKLHMIVIDTTYYLWHSTVELPTYEWASAWWLTDGSTSASPTWTSKNALF